MVPGDDHDASLGESFHEEGESEAGGPVPSSPIPSTVDVASDGEGKESEKPSENSYDSDIDKDTLRLGTPSPASVSDEDMRDSQVSSGWLGRAYNKESRKMKREDTMAKLAQVGSSKLKISWLMYDIYGMLLVSYSVHTSY